MTQTLKNMMTNIKELRAKTKPHLRRAQKVFDAVFPPPKKTRH